MVEQETAGIIVRAEPRFLPEESKPDEGRFVWAYTIEIENRSETAVKLLSRYWRITDQNGATQEVRGAGVIGQQPTIAPGTSFRYSSAAPLTAPAGIMLGAYEMEAANGDTFSIAVPAFPLESPHETRMIN